MVSVRYANAITEVLQYLKGIREEDIKKIPKSFMTFLEENASKEYECSIDYKKPLKELELMDETKGIIGLICYNYWCDTEENKSEFLKKLNENEKVFQKELEKKYDIYEIFRKRQENNYYEDIEEVQNTSLVVVEENKIVKIYKKIINFIKSIIKR